MSVGAVAVWIQALGDAVLDLRPIVRADDVSVEKLSKILFATKAPKLWVFILEAVDRTEIRSPSNPLTRLDSCAFKSRPAACAVRVARNDVGEPVSTMKS